MIVKGSTSSGGSGCQTVDDGGDLYMPGMPHFTQSDLVRNWKNRRELISKRPLKLDRIVTVATEALWHEMREFLPSARVAFPDIEIVVGTDVPLNEAQALADSLFVPNVRIVEIDMAEALPHLTSVCKVADYWVSEAIWWQLELFRREIADGATALLCDSDITFRLDFERSFYGDVVLSPFYWGDLGLLTRANPLDPERTARTQLHVRDGLFNAGMVMSRSLEFAEWWMAAFLSGEFGFYEQKCLDAVPAQFPTDYFSPKHNFGKWRFAPPFRTVRSYHQHVREPARRPDVILLKMEAQEAAAEARAELREKYA